MPVPPHRPEGLDEGACAQGQEPGEAASRNVEKMLGNTPSSSSSSSSSSSTPAPEGTPLPPHRPEGLGEGAYAQGQEPGEKAGLNEQRMLSEDSKPRGK